MDPLHFLGDFRSPAPLHANAIGCPRQIAYYSYFPEAAVEEDRYKYNSSGALKRYQPPRVPFSLPDEAGKPAFNKMANRLDSLPQQGLEPVITACNQVGCTADLREANVITRRGVVLGLSLGTKGVYTFSFVQGKLCILRKDFQMRTEVQGGGPYYGHCFEGMCTGSKPGEPASTFFSVVHRKIGDLNIVMAGEVDCSQSVDGEPGLNDYIELKTTRLGSGRRAQLYPKFYMQSYLLGVQTVTIGERSSGNDVTALTQKSTDEFLQDVRKYAPEFDPAVNLGRVHAILSRLLYHFPRKWQPVTDQDRFELRVTAKGRVLVTSLPSSSK